MEPPQVSPEETAELLRLAESTLPLSGDWVEFGCYKGETSLLLARLLQKYRLSSNSTPASTSTPITNDKLLYLYDSFAGLPEKSVEDASSAGENFRAGALLVTKKEVVDKLRHAGLDLRQIRIKKSFFSDLDPETDVPEKISFAFLDGDLYSSIRISLALAAPRLTKNGLMVVHDYNNPSLPGASRATDEFLRSHSGYKLETRFSLAILHKVC